MVFPPPPAHPLALAAGAALLAAGAAGAVPRLDLTPYPAPAAGQNRWVVQLPGIPPPSRDPGLSSDPADWRVELIVGRNALVDCNLHRFSGRIRSAPLPGGDRTVLRVEDVTPMASTRMACPPDQPQRRVFVPMGDEPFLVPFQGSQPIVLYAPAELELRWRLWRADRRTTPARQL